MKKILLVFGTRPEAIKMASLYHELIKNKDFEVKICVTAQHREMLDQVLNIFDLKPDYDLDIMKANQSLENITSTILLKIIPIIKSEIPDIVLVHGDTTTTFATALACFYQNTIIGHVEAGLRTYNIRSPFPEEYNRKATGIISKYHYAPTLNAKENLINEGVVEDNIIVTGNTVVDSLKYIDNKLVKNKKLNDNNIENLNKILGFDLSNNKYILITGHRRENFGVGLDNICNAIKEISRNFPNIYFVYSVHLNPLVEIPVNMILGGISNIKLIPPQEYLSFVNLLKHSYAVITDSGGIQEEAPTFSIPVFVTRDHTERAEGVEFGCIKLVGSDFNQIVNKISNTLRDSIDYKSMQTKNNPFGDGMASKRISDHLTRVL